MNLELKADAVIQENYRDIYTAGTGKIVWEAVAIILIVQTTRKRES